MKIKVLIDLHVKFCPNKFSAKAKLPQPHTCPTNTSKPVKVGVWLIASEMVVIALTVIS
jgi:hypothetical protein